MAACDYERLTALDATFLGIEDENAHMHVGGVVVFDAAPLRNADGTIDIERVRRLVEWTFRKYPRYRQRIAWTPIFRRPVWVDDPRFNLHYHVRHTSLPKPGGDRELKRFAARVMSQPLDRAKPLWEMWLVEGLSGERVALVSKIHHCMIDGVSGADLVAGMLRWSSEPDPYLDEPPARWIPRPMPTPRELLSGEFGRLTAVPWEVTGTVMRALADPRAALEGARRALAGIGMTVGASMRGASDTPLNRQIGPHRRFDWTEIALDDIKAIKKRLGGTVNDVVLTVVSGAVGRFLGERGVRIDDLDFRAMVPVNTRATSEHDSLGNRVASMLARLPIGERDPERRFQNIVDLMIELKNSAQTAGVRAIEELADLTSGTILSALARFAAKARTYNIVVTNIPGPQIPLYLLGARMHAIYPLVPLFENQALGVAVFSYDGKLHWGFNADHDEIPDLHEFVGAVEAEFQALRQPDRPVELRLAVR